MEEDVKILCVDDEKNVLKSLNRIFLDDDYEIITAESGEEGLRAMEEEDSIQVVISDYRMPGMNGVDFLKKVCDRWPNTVRIVLSGYADTASIVAAINEGQIYKFIPKPWNDDELKITIAKAIETYFLQQRNLELTKELQDSNEELTKLNENLEALVEERTSEIAFQNKVLSRSQLILDSLPVGVIGIDTSGCIVQCNKSSGDMVAKKDAALIGQQYTTIEDEGIIAFIEELKETEKLSKTVSLADNKIMIKGSVLGGEKGLEGLVLVLVPLEK